MGFPTQKCTRTLKCQYDCTEMYYVLKYQCEFDCIQHRIPCIYVAFDCWLALFRYFIIFKMFASFLKLKQTPKIVQWKQLGTSQLCRIYTKSKITCPRNAFTFEISSMLQIKKYAQNIYTCIFGVFKPNFLNLCVDPVKLAHSHFIQVNTK